ncbi:AAEL001201-PA [Aedes aegypti]|uniref:AAEL001201-PA n=2 Tax=Aedes aegypti TaxID=7159 RepID=Q17LX3_AEDAE|nr:uncharacterized protein LOC5569073 [Aedes aegypti]XP_021703043.1 uncharacterized protein LOC5569073 [Aedes aegypti]ABM68583.1 AAEL001201-PA [Aedes aegypti]EAT47698.1 AAEL001201-PA [Aedes aegypti]
MTSVQSQEDLEARIARILKRNEEIEKKHREAEADRLMAMKENAMVEIKPPKDDDWPREHKYDKIDFTYDLDEDALAELEEKKKEKNAFIQKIAKDYKVFAEGEGPPPDPAYSFLADVERDGEKALPAPVGSVGAKINKNNFERKNPNNRSGRQAGNGSNIAGGNRGGGRGGGKTGYNGNLQRSLSTNEHDGRRPQEHARHGPGAGHKPGGDGKWRREWEQDRSKDDCCIHNAQNNGFKGEPNLTVSVSQDGEFKSVKVTSPPIIGSGRVGPRQPAKPQFQFQTSGLHPGMEHHHHPHHHQQQHHSSHGHPAQHQGSGGKQPHHRNNDSFNRNSSGRKSDKDVRRGPKQGPGQSATSNKQPQTGGGSVQDRLNRNRSVNIDRNDNSIKVSTNNGGESVSSQPQPKANATLKTISKIIEKNAEIDEKLARQMHQENEKMANRVKELRMQDGA